MTRKMYWKCDYCGIEKEAPNETQNILHISCGTDTYHYPHGDFCSIDCAVAYLTKWKSEVRLGEILREI